MLGKNINLLPKIYVYVYLYQLFLIHLNIGGKQMLRKFNLFNILVFKFCEGKKGVEGIHLRPIENDAVFFLLHSLSYSFLTQGLLK